MHGSTRGPCLSGFVPGRKWHGVLDQTADVAHQGFSRFGGIGLRRNTRTLENKAKARAWVKKLIPSAFASALWSRGRAVGTQRRRSSRALLFEDHRVRSFVKTKYRSAAIPKVEIERTRDEVKIILFTARPGVIIGRKGQEVDRLQGELQDLWVDA